MRAGRRIAAAVSFAALLGSLPALAGDVESAALVVAANHLARPAAAQVPRASAAALQAYLATLDPYSRFLSPDEVRAASGAHHGLGALVTDTPDGLLLVPFQGGPAASAGIAGPSTLLAVDGHAAPAEVENVRPLLAGRREVDLTVRDLVTGRHATRRVPLRSFEVPPVETLTIGGRTIIRLHVFEAGRTVPALRAALEKAAARPGLPVLDLRYAKGGDLLEAIDAVSLVLGRPVPVAATRDAAGQETAFRSRSGQRVTSPVYLLVGPQTASAAEVFARALSHWRHGFAVGQPTYGKCLVQKHFPLPEGGALLLTTARLLDPAGNHCAGKGLAPDLLVSGNIHDTDHVLAALDAYLADTRLVCRAAPLKGQQPAQTEEERLGWAEGVGRMRPVPFDAPGGATRLCLMPPLPAAVAAAVRHDQEKRSGPDTLELRTPPPAAPITASIGQPTSAAPAATSPRPAAKPEPLARPTPIAKPPPPAPAGYDTNDPAAPLRPTGRAD